MERHKQKIINKAGTVAAPVKKVKKGIENTTNLIHCPRKVVKLVYIHTSSSTSVQVLYSSYKNCSNLIKSCEFNHVHHDVTCA